MDFSSILQGIGGGLQAGFGGGQPGPGQDPNAQDPGMMQKIMGILAAGANGFAGKPTKPGPVKSIFRKGNPNVKARPSLNATGAAPGIDLTGASLPGLTAGLPGPPAALSTPPGDDTEE